MAKLEEMADPNGAHEWRDDMERRVEALEKARRDLEDSFIVMTQLETRMSRALREQAEWLQAHESRIRRAEILLTELTDKINFIIDRDMRREGGPENAR